MSRAEITLGGRRIEPVPAPLGRRLGALGREKGSALRIRYGLQGSILPGVAALSPIDLRRAASAGVADLRRVEADWFRRIETVSSRRISEALFRSSAGASYEDCASSFDGLPGIVRLAVDVGGGLYAWLERNASVRGSRWTPTPDGAEGRRNAAEHRPRPSDRVGTRAGRDASGKGRIAGLDIADFAASVGVPDSVVRILRGPQAPIPATGTIRGGRRDGNGLVAKEGIRPPDGSSDAEKALASELSASIRVLGERNVRIVRSLYGIRTDRKSLARTAKEIGRCEAAVLDAAVRSVRILASGSALTAARRIAASVPDGTDGPERSSGRSRRGATALARDIAEAGSGKSPYALDRSDVRIGNARRIADMDGDVRGDLDRIGIAALAGRIGMGERTCRVLDAEPGLPTVLDCAADPFAVETRLLSINRIGPDKAARLLSAAERLVADAVAGRSPGRSEGGALAFAAGRPPTEDPAVGLEAVVETLRDSHRLAVRARYGLGRNGTTFAVLASEMGLSVQRAQQVAKAALSRLSGTTAPALAARYLESVSAEMYDAVFDGGGFVPVGHRPPRDDDLPEYAPLSLALTGSDAAGWRKERSIAMGRVLVRDDVAARIPEGAEEVFSRAVRGLPMPYPSSSVADLRDFDAETVAVLAAASGTHRVVDGYLLRDPVSSPQTAAVRIHSALASIGSDADVRSVADVDRRMRPHLPPIRPSIEKVASDNPHLLGRMWDGRVLSVLSAPDDPVGREPVPDDPAIRRSCVRKRSEDTISGFVRTLLEREGPLSLGDIDAAARKAPDGPPRNSLTAILAIDGGFRRIAPGHYDVDDRPQGARRTIPKTMLSAKACRFLALARASGATGAFYPAWTPEYELALARWASAGNRTGHLASLVSTCDVAAWPCGDVERGELVAVGTATPWSTDELPAPPMEGIFPTPTEFFAGLVHLVGNGTIGWVAADRICGFRPGSGRGAVLLALMVASGASAAGTRWTTPQPATTEATEILRRWRSDPWSAEGRSWEHGAPSEVLERTSNYRGHGTWVPADDLHRAVAGRPRDGRGAKRGRPFGRGWDRRTAGA